MNKYFLYIVNNKKAILLSNSDSKTDLRTEALDRIGDKIEKYNGLWLYRVKIMKVSKKDFASEANSQIKFIGGPWVAIVERILIDYNNKRTKLKSVDNDVNRIYFSDKYFKKYNNIQQKSVDQLVYDFVHKKFNDGLFAINTIDK
jgi:hypothetical protein